MIKYIYLFALGCIFLLGCRKQDVNSTDTPTEISTDSASQKAEETPAEIEDDSIVEKLPINIFPFGYNLSEFVQDSTNEYGGGDCWSRITRYTKKDIGFITDSMNCGDYGFEYKYFLIENNEIVLAHFQFAEIDWLKNGQETIHILREEVYDLRENSSIYITKKDTFERRNLDFLKLIPFTTDTLENQPKTQRMLDSLSNLPWTYRVEKE